VPRGRQWFALVPCFGLLIAIPFLLLSLASANWQATLAWSVIPVAAIGVFLAPAVTCVQNRSGAESRSVNGALFLFVNNLVGAGFGPLYVGSISDWANERQIAPFDLAPLTLGLLACVPVLLIAATLQANNARLLARES
jgi:hypothetical protein